MSKPSNPKEIIFKSEYYPKGLTTGQIYNYYIKNKNKILKECLNQPVLMFLSFDINKPLVVKRNHDRTSIILNERNYESLINGHLISLSMETSNPTNFWVIDIDSKNNQKESVKKKALYELLDFFKNECPFKIKNHRITNTSTGYHLFLYLNQKMNLNISIKLLNNLLKNKFQNKYDINPYKSGNNISFDFTPMKNRGSFVVPYSLNRNGLKCLDLTNEIKNFKRKDAILK
jgi:hypothetical protein